MDLVDTEVTYSKEEVDAILTETIKISVVDKLKESRKKMITIIIAVLLCLVVLLLLMTGFVVK